jgi:hypothetical protein
MRRNEESRIGADAFVLPNGVKTFLLPAGDCCETASDRRVFAAGTAVPWRRKRLDTAEVNVWTTRKFTGKCHADRMVWLVAIVLCCFRQCPGLSGWSRPEMRCVPSLIRLELPWARDRRSDGTAGIVVELDHHQAKRRVKPERWIGNRQCCTSRLRLLQRLS